MKSSQIILLLLSLLSPSMCRAFVAPLPSSLPSPATTSKRNSGLATTLSAKKKKRSSSSGEGFGKKSSGGAVLEEGAATASSTDAPRALQSIDAPSAPQRPANDNLNLDPNLSPEERSQAILRSKFGLKSYEEQQADLGDYRALVDAENKKEKRDKLRNLDKVWPEDKDFVAVLPPGLIKGIDSFLKLGLGVCTVLFLVAGVFITIEAGSKATGSELPAGLEEFVINVVQPNFTPGLGVLLAFSVSLGLFSVALGGSAQSSYREDP
eukprot:CAMPEP_0172527694 /NCGR_PEP_ID=MMETSP1067-20121228/2320_1 /TAXON_ID=265564 ORGANISM="Thalassiosira punctigera, Strain Tpunct2005C2" /NCGR_SAMPLE_ID=MMETSP1067 /ASSEMBLY_ACC=CAM_ASM_000444 /LENGTH=265 /DNA_ID=CAMNT_0013311487 /DNA_START=186 /DNA_END=983 /DNA_ORIENTATION=-